MKTLSFLILGSRFWASIKYHVFYTFWNWFCHKKKKNMVSQDSTSLPVLSIGFYNLMFMFAVQVQNFPLMKWNPYLLNNMLFLLILSHPGTFHSFYAIPWLFSLYYYKNTQIPTKETIYIKVQVCILVWYLNIIPLLFPKLRCDQ